MTHVSSDDIRNAAAMVSKVYEFSPCGGNAHVVLSDLNVDDESINWCLTEALAQNLHEADPDQLAAERLALESLKPLDELGRVLAINLVDVGP